MAKRRKLKVFRTPIGFHDAYVAAPSQKAALEAWGADADLFARGIAELVTDPELAKEPLAKPGEVVRRLRGTAEEQLAALPKTSPRKRPAKVASEPKPRPRKRTRPPSRKPVEDAEAALADMEHRHASEGEELEEKMRALKREATALEKSQAAERARLEKAAERARSAYRRAIDRYDG